LEIGGILLIRLTAYGKMRIKDDINHRTIITVN